VSFELLQIPWDKFGTRRVEKIGDSSGKLGIKILKNQQLTKNKSDSLSLRRHSFYPLNYGGGVVILQVQPSALWV
jgi:hypothetical protein